MDKEIIQVDEAAFRGHVHKDLSNVAGALHSPNGMVVNCHKPCPVVKAVSALSSGAMATCQYPLWRSNEENHAVLAT
jgi:hypothetical protein